MDTTNPRVTQITFRFQRFIALAWHWLSRPQLTASLLVGLALVLLLNFFIPQQPTFDTTFAEWTAIIPAWLRPWDQLIYFLGLSRISQLPWLWVPVALLLFHSLIALAEYVWPSWQRSHLTKSSIAIKWQHPLSKRVEHSVRLPAAPDELLEKLRT